jgi:protein ImuB
MQPGFITQQRRYLALYLPTWPTDFAKRHDPALKAPLALYERIKGGLRLAAIDREAAQLGLSVGQNLADARGMVPALTLKEIDRPMLEAAFADFADWHSNASPLVSVQTAMHPFGDLVLDITGVTHLFGGEANMLNLLCNRLRGLGFAADGAIASTIGAAWAASHFAVNRVIPADTTGTLLDQLSVAALRLAPEQIAGLSQMGLKRIGQLRGRDRKALQARFGLSLLTRLDQAYGLIEERLVPRLPLAECYAERRFPDPIGLIDDVMMTTHDLAIQLGIRLEAAGLGAQAFHLFLYRVDHKVIALSLNSGRATRDATHIARLFTNRAERLAGEYDAGFGIDMIRLAASSLSPLDASQLSALDIGEHAQDIGQLYDRMTSRLGPLAVVRSKFVNTHNPERAVVLEPVIARTPDDPEAAPNPRALRPPRLLPHPERIEVTAEVPDGPPAIMIWRRIAYRFVKASGPERLGSEWWRSGMRLQLVPPPEPKPPAPGEKLQKPPYVPNLVLLDPEAATRDYYIAEDAGGRRFWLFRHGLYGSTAMPEWFLHGFFP